MSDIISKIDIRFSSGNDVPVTRAHITDVEWKMLRDEICSLRELCAAAYQALGNADGPMEMLDNLFEAAQGRQLRHSPMAGLPWSQPVTPAAVAAVPNCFAYIHVPTFLVSCMSMKIGAALEKAKAAATHAPVAQKVPTVREMLDAGLCPVPNGWALVPVEPTTAMYRAGYEANDRHGMESVRDVWDAMLAAAKAQEAEQ